MGNQALTQKGPTLTTVTRLHLILYCIIREIPIGGPIKNLKRFWIIAAEGN